MSQTIDLDQPTRDEELARLVRAIGLAKGFRLYFAKSEFGKSREDLIEEISRASGDVRRFDVRPGLDHLRTALEAEVVDASPPIAMCVTGIETWIPAGIDGATSPFIRNLNASRDRFAQTIPCPLVIWGNDHVLRAIQSGAPDFFSAASGIYLFPDEMPLENGHDLVKPYLEGATLWLRELAELEDRLQLIHRFDRSESSIDRIDTLNRMVVTLLHLGHYTEAESLALSTYKEACDAMGADHPISLAGSNNLASLYEEIGWYDQAERLYTQTLEASRRVLGPEHPDTLSCLNNLAYLYRVVGRLKDTEPLYISVLEARRRIFGADHPDTIRSSNNLASLFLITGRIGEAEALFVQALEASQKNLGSDHLETLLSRNNLAILYYHSGRLVEAESLFQAIMESTTRNNGPDHPTTLLSVNNLAGLYLATGRADVARDFLDSSIDAARTLPIGHKTRHAFEELYEIASASGGSSPNLELKH